MIDDFLVIAKWINLSVGTVLSVPGLYVSVEPTGVPSRVTARVFVACLAINFKPKSKNIVLPDPPSSNGSLRTKPSTQKSRSEESRVGKECVRTCTSRWRRDH